MNITPVGRQRTKRMEKNVAALDVVLCTVPCGAFVRRRRASPAEKTPAAATTRAPDVFSRIEASSSSKRKRWEIVALSALHE